MRELTMHEMSVKGGEFSFGNFFEGFLCGTFIVGAIAITPTTSVVTRLGIYGGMIAACGTAFFG